MSIKHLEVAQRYGKWALSHNGQALASFATEAEAERAAAAIARTQPADDEVELLVFEDAAERQAA